MAKKYYGNDIDLTPDKIKQLTELGYTRVTDPTQLSAGDIVIGGTKAEGGLQDNQLNGATRIWGNNREQTAAALQGYIEANQPKPTFTGPSTEDVIRAWKEKMRSGVEQSANEQINTIKQNLAEILSNLETEKANAQSQNKKQLETIHNNEFATSEIQKELMNQAGWNPTNSGLAIGELGKIKIGADKERADANDALVQALNDIARRVNLANTKASNDITSIQNWKSAQLAGAEADALLKANELEYQRYRDALADWENNRNFEYQKDIDQRNFDYQKNIDERNYNYQVSRDKVLDEQWLKQFNAQEQQRLIDNAIKNKQISLDEGRLALERAAQAWAKDPNNPDNIYKMKQIESMNDKNDSSYTIGPLYSSMMNSANPEEWLKENAKYLTDDELTTLYNLYYKSKNSNLDLQDLLNK